MNKNLAKLFVILSLFFGMIFIFIVPSYNSPDEDSHFQYAYEISVGRLLPKVKNGVSGFDVPNAITKSIEDDKNKIASNLDEKYSYQKLYYAFFYDQDMKQESFSNAVIQSTPKLAYIAPAVGIIIGRLINFGVVSPQLLLQYARFFSLLIYTIIGYYAIKITPKYKKSFFAVLLLPVSLFLRSMVTYDGLLLVTVALVIANILRLIHNKDKFTKKDFVFFIITGFLLFKVKMVYSIVLFGLLAVPNESFGSKNRKIKSLLMVFLGVLLITFLQKIPYMVIGGAGEISSQEQINFIKSNPFTYLKILFRNIVGQTKIQLNWMLGTLGYLDTFIPQVMITIILIYLIIIFMIDAMYEKIILPLWLKIGYLLLVIFDVMGIYTMMYISWTPKVYNQIGGSTIAGVQGRYYLPFLLLIPIIFSNNLINRISNNKKIYSFINKYKTIFENNFHYITITSLVVSTIYLLIRYY